MSEQSSHYSVLTAGVELRTELERKKSRFLTVMRRAETGQQAQQLVDRLRIEHHTARHHCSAWVIGPDRRIQRANDDGEPSGTAGAPMLEALTKAQVLNGDQNLSDVVVVVVRWFGGTLLGAGGLVSAYSDSVVACLDQARSQRALLRRQRLRRFSLPAPIAEAGRWENELRSWDVTVLGIDYASSPGSAVLSLAVADNPQAIEGLHARAATLSAGSSQLWAAGTEWVDTA